MRERYIELMERTLSAYTMEHIERYFNDVKENGLKEHGFPRLASNIGIIIAHGRRRDLLPIFLEMMEFCCKTIPVVKAANDFSVREVINAIREVRAAGVVDGATIDRWLGYLATIDPHTCYDKLAYKPDDKVKNWALFTCVSEFFRQREGLCQVEEFIDTQIASQLQWMDENSMYMDAKGDIYHHITYDIVPRGLFVTLLDAGYRGKYFKAIDEHLRRAGLLTLKMQSPTGEMAFGGRSNQFLHNELWMCAIFEYEAKRYAREGNLELAGKFKAAIARAVSVTEYWLSLNPIRHIKNRFPTETRFGCEDYAYFDKYMITVASNLHAAYLICDDGISVGDDDDTAPEVFATSYHFHKLFLKAGGYGIELDLNADQHYDCSGVGRVHRIGAPSTICMSVPCPSDPLYSVNIPPVALSLAPGVKTGNGWRFATDGESKYNILGEQKSRDTASAKLSVNIPGGNSVECDYTVSADGVVIEAKGTGELAYMLPAFHFDGEAYTAITNKDNILEIGYKGWICRYTSSAPITATEITAPNRNGYYKEYITASRDSIKIKIEIIEA